MSRGPGRVERTILSLGRTPLLVTQIARRAYDLARAAEVTPIHCQAVRRSLRKLEKVGVVERIYDEPLGRWRWQCADVRASEQVSERRQRALERQWRAEQRRAAIEAREAAIRAAENVSRLSPSSKKAEPLTLATREEMMRPPPRVRMTRRRSQRPGTISIGQLWATDIVVPREDELASLIARITRLWAGLYEAKPALALDLLAKLPKTKIHRAR
jgi:hypothetical protein